MEESERKEVGRHTVGWAARKFTLPSQGSVSVTRAALNGIGYPGRPNWQRAMDETTSYVNGSPSTGQFSRSGNSLRYGAQPAILRSITALKSN